MKKMKPLVGIIIIEDKTIKTLQYETNAKFLFLLDNEKSNVTNIKEMFPKSAHKLAQTEEDRAIFIVLLIFIL